MPNINVKANIVGDAPEVGVQPYRPSVQTAKANVTWNATGNLKPTFPETDYFAWTYTGTDRPPVPERRDATTLSLDYDNKNTAVWTYRVRIQYEGGPSTGIWIDPEIDNRPPGG